MRLVTPEETLEAVEEVEKWATEMNPPDYAGIERPDDLSEYPALLRGYNTARHHVAALLKAEK